MNADQSKQVLPVMYTFSAATDDAFRFAATRNFWVCFGSRETVQGWGDRPGEAQGAAVLVSRGAVECKVLIGVRLAKDLGDFHLVEPRDKRASRSPVLLLIARSIHSA